MHIDKLGIKIPGRFMRIYVRVNRFGMCMPDRRKSSMFSMIIAVLLITVAIGMIAIGEVQDQHESFNVRKWSWIPLLIAAVVLAFACTAMVGTKQVGVVTTFNRPTGTMTNGLHFKAPWQKVTEMDGTIQTDSYTGSGKVTCIDIRIGNGSVACIDTTIRWRIVPDEADVLFQDYRNQEDDVNDAIQDSLVKRELTGALNEVYGSYDPLAAVKGGVNVEVDALSAQVQEAMRNRVQELGNGTPQVEILSVTTPLIRLDRTTQEKIDAYQQEVANTRIAEQKQATAEAEAKANEAISASISKDPNVLAYKCLNIMAELAKTEAGVPVGMYCFPGGNAPVLVPGK